MVFPISGNTIRDVFRPKRANRRIRVIEEVEDAHKQDEDNAGSRDGKPADKPAAETPENVGRKLDISL